MWLLLPSSSPIFRSPPRMFSLSSFLYRRLHRWVGRRVSVRSAVGRSVLPLRRLHSCKNTLFFRLSPTQSAQPDPASVLAGSGGRGSKEVFVPHFSGSCFATTPRPQPLFLSPPPLNPPTLSRSFYDCRCYCVGRFVIALPASACATSMAPSPEGAADCHRRSVGRGLGRAWSVLCFELPERPLPAARLLP